MPRSFRLLTLGTLVWCSALSLACSNASEDCVLNASCDNPTTSGTAGGGGVAGNGGNAGNGGSGGAGGGAGGGIPMDCMPMKDATVDDSCGIFVSSSLGDDGNNGLTKDAPMQTLAAALAAAGANTPVYVCGETFATATTVEVPSGATVYGGFACSAGWTYSDAPADRSALSGAAIALKLVAGAGTTRVFDFAVKADDGSQPGESSIAVLATGTAAELTRCDFQAGNGANGADGQAPNDDPTLDGAPGADGLWENALMCGAANTIGYTGPAGGTKACVQGAAPGAGGTGGDGTVAAMGGNGGDGPGGGGVGGVGEDMSLMGGGKCGDGGSSGALNGGDGMAGAGASGVGTLTSDGFQSLAGVDGDIGIPGKGGGGGGGAKTCDGAHAGPSGASGGSGACGGLGGPGGGGAGSSIALASVGAQLSVRECTLSAADGGDGGDGGDGQKGGNGGQAGTGVQGAGNIASCHGGDGGDGGDGGFGGGGLGGHSIGAAFSGTAPDIDGSVTTTTAGVGQGGVGAGNPGQGADGVQSQLLEL